MSTTSRPAPPDLPEIRRRQQRAWAAADYGRIGVRMQIVGELLCEAVDLRASERVLDVGAGNGNASRAAAELVRVVRPLGRIGLATWTPEGFVGALTRTVACFAPAPAGLPSPLDWGTEPRLAELFGAQADGIQVVRREFVFRNRSPRHWIDQFRLYHGPMQQTFAALDAAGQQALQRALVELLEKFNRGGRDTLIVPAEYLEVVIRRA